MIELQLELVDGLFLDKFSYNLNCTGHISAHDM